MLESISPYALLKASKPKPPAVIVTAYDLYSTAQSAAQPDMQPPPSAQIVQPAQSAQDAQPVPDPPATPVQAHVPAARTAPAPYISTRRTHYIRDIETRHDAALRRTKLQTGRMAQPSSQQPET